MAVVEVLKVLKVSSEVIKSLQTSPIIKSPPQGATTMAVNMIHI
jgi:hypothetical protein